MFSKWVDLTFNLIRKELKARYFGTFLGFLWALGNPMITFGLYYFVFTFILPNPSPNYALYLVTGTLHWAIFTQILTQGTGYLLDNAYFIKKINFPKIIVAVAGLGTNLVFWAAALVIYFMLYQWFSI
jgi:lipopolysaccharide transport system permease protein